MSTITSQNVSTTVQAGSHYVTVTHRQGQQPVALVTDDQGELVERRRFPQGIVLAWLWADERVAELEAEHQAELEADEDQDEDQADEDQDSFIGWACPCCACELANGDTSGCEYGCDPEHLEALCQWGLEADQMAVPGSATDDVRSFRCVGCGEDRMDYALAVHALSR